MIGVSIGIATGGRSNGAPLLAALSGAFELPETADAGAIAGTLAGLTASSTLELIDDAGGRVAIDGNAIVRGATGIDYEAVTSHPFTIRETKVGASNSPRTTTLSLTVQNVLEVTLAALTGTFSKVEDSSVGATIGAIGGVTSGSILSLSDDAGGKVAISGTNLVVGAAGIPTPGSYSFTVRETHADGSNSPRDTAFTLTVTSAVQPMPTRVSRTASSGNGGSGTVNTGNASGDFMVMIVLLQASGTVSTPAGWTLVAQASGIGVFCRTATGANEDPTVSNSGFGDWAAYVTCFTGADTASATLANSVSADPPSHNAGASRNHFWIAAVKNGATTSGAPSGYGNHASQWSPSFFFGMGIADRSVALSQTEDPGAFVGASGSGPAATVAVWRA